MMILRRRITNSYNMLVRKIRKEIIDSLQRKGVEVSQIHVDLKRNNVSLSLSVREE